MNAKKIPNVVKPFARIHNVLSALNFEAVSGVDGTAYVLTFVDRIENKRYYFQVITRMSKRGNGTSMVQFSEAGFAGVDRIPSSVYEAAASIISEAFDYLMSDKPDDAAAAALDGTMVRDETDMRKLGKEMKHMKTNSQLLEEGYFPDPRQ